MDEAVATRRCQAEMGRRVARLMAIMPSAREIKRSLGACRISAAVAENVLDFPSGRSGRPRLTRPLPCWRQSSAGPLSRTPSQGVRAWLARLQSIPLARLLRRIADHLWIAR